MSSILILGDVHLGKGTNIGKAGLGTSLNSRIVDQMHLLDWTLDQAIERNAQQIVITGDVFEEPKPHPSLIVLFLSWIKKCEAQGIKVHIVMGNHDMLRSGAFVTSPLDIISECEIEGIFIHKELTTITLGSVSLTFMPFRDRKSFVVDSNTDAVKLLNTALEYELASIPLTYTKILIGHLAIEGSIWVGDEVDDISNELFCPVEMFQGFDYVWMGHVHKPQVMQKFPHIAHIGSMDLSNFGESDHKKYLILFDVEDQTFSEIEVPTRSLRKVTITVPKDTKDTTKFIVDEIQKNYKDLSKAIVKVEVNLASPELGSMDRGVIEKALYKAGVFNVSALSESKKLSLVKKSDTAVIDTTMDVPSAIKMWAGEKYPNKKDEDRKNRFIEVAMSILNKFKNEGKDA